MLAPVLPLGIAMTVVSWQISRAGILTPVATVLAVALTAAIVATTAVARLHALSVARTLELRVAERTLALEAVSDGSVGWFSIRRMSSPWSTGKVSSTTRHLQWSECSAIRALSSSDSRWCSCCGETTSQWCWPHWTRPPVTSQDHTPCSSRYVEQTVSGLTLKRRLPRCSTSQMCAVWCLILAMSLNDFDSRRN